MSATPASGAPGSTAGGDSPAGAGRGLCLFDLDETLLPIDSDHAWGAFMPTLGWADPKTFAEGNERFYAQYRAAALDIHAYIDYATKPLRGRSPAELDAAHARFMRECIEPQIREPARQLVEQHRRLGDRIAMVSATNEFVTGPIARAFGIETLLAVRLERDADGRITGRIAGTPSYREGKVARVAEWLAGDGLGWHDFDRITAYSDSINDLPMLERATQPVATNPSQALLDVARQRGWRILNLFQ